MEVHFVLTGIILVYFEWIRQMCKFSLYYMNKIRIYYNLKLKLNWHSFCMTRHFLGICIESKHFLEEKSIFVCDMQNALRDTSE